jgi:hypothetical protein
MLFLMSELLKVSTRENNVPLMAVPVCHNYHAVPCSLFFIDHFSHNIQFRVSNQVLGVTAIKSSFPTILPGQWAAEELS